MGKQDRLPVGWEWTGWGRTALRDGVSYLYPPGKGGADFVGAAHSNGSWCAYASLDDQEPFAEHEADDDAAFTPEAHVAAQRDVEDALWRVDGYGTGEVRGRHLPKIEPYTKVPAALPGLPGLWTVTRWVLSPTGSGVEVDARKVTAGESDVEPADPEVSVHREVVRNPRAFALRQVEPAPVASEDADELARLSETLAEDIERTRAVLGSSSACWDRVARAAELLLAERTEALALLGDDAALGLVEGLKRSRYVARSEADTERERLTARVAELESDLDDLHTRYAETMVAFDDAAPDALRALHKRQVDAQSLDATLGAEMAEKVRAALRRKPGAAKEDA